MKVAIAGAGGLGGPVAYILARLGVGEIRLADADKFEASNLNRQFGAYIDTIGKYKAEAISEELKRINPYLKVRFWNEFIDENNVDEFLDKTDVVIDAIDFFELKNEIILHLEARKRNLWVFTSQAAKEILSFTSFNPSGKSILDAIMINGTPDLRKAISFFFPVLPKGVTPEIIDNIIGTNQLHIASHATPPSIGSGYLVEEIIKVAIRGVAPLAEAPAIFIVDLEKMFIKKFEIGE